MSVIVTGAAGFISSGLITYLNEKYPNTNIIAVDKFNIEKKMKNLERKVISRFIDRDELFNPREFDFSAVDLIIHLGARTDTAEINVEIFNKLNLSYSKNIWQKCVEHKIPLIYASSAATYGDGKLGFSDNESLIPNLKPLNPYGDSKNEFDKWTLSQNEKPPLWTGLKFFNVFGPNEYHKGRMASVVFHAFNQIMKEGTLKLFRSHNPDYSDGGQMRDFIYVKDIFKVIDHIYSNKDSFQSGIYNLGTGKARTFLDLAMSVFYALDKKPDISFIDTPEDIRDKYQYFTKAEMDKLRIQGYLAPFFTLEAGVIEYVRNYLSKGQSF
ncbi:MAG: ADP-glyceromanno-heptose 6-epimerase [Saprospiraceae bacterium]|nr:ADP-glyceromanno-heptose 6-epimerase [Saprospiraceae bacterium]